LKLEINSIDSEVVSLFKWLLEEDKQKYVAFLETGAISLDEFIDDLISVRKNDASKCAEMVFLAVRKAISEKFVDINKFGKLLGVYPEQALELLRAEYKLVKFPVVSKDKALSKIAYALVFNDEIGYTNLSHQQASIDVIRKLKGKNFSVVFDTMFYDESFMLAVTVGAFSKNVPENLVFTGKIGEHGNILPVNSVNEKEEIARSEKLTLISPLDAKHIDDVIILLNAQGASVPVFYTYQDNDDAEKKYESFVEFVSSVQSNCIHGSDIRLAEKVFGFSTLLKYKKLDFSDWNKLAIEGGDNLRKIAKAGFIPNLAFEGPGPLAMGVGIRFGAQYPILVYHKVAQGYAKVIDLSDNLRKIKTVRQSFERFDVEVSGDGDTCVYIIKTASHELKAQVIDFVRKEAETDFMYIYASHKNSGNLPVEDWTIEVSELMSIVQKVKAEKVINRIEFFMSCPIPIAFGFGMAFGHFGSGKIYAYNNTENTYTAVIKIEELK